MKMYESGEDYLEAILRLQLENGFVRSVDVANKLAVSRPSVSRAMGVLEKDGYILFLARIVPEKGLHYLIDAFMQTDTDKKLVIAGGVSHSGEYAKRIHDMAKDGRIIFTGFVEGDELWELYYNCRMYVLPSDVEGMPISLLEAMACGCECLVRDIDTAKNVVGEYGYTFKKSDVNDLKNKLCEILGKQKADKAEQIEYVKNNYSWDEITDRTLELYKK